MKEVQVLQEDLNGLGWTIKSLLDENFQNPETLRAVKKIKGSLGITESITDVSVTLLFDHGELSIQNGFVGRPSAFLSGTFDDLSEVISGQVGLIKALFTGRVKVRGNLIKLLMMVLVIISKNK